MTKKQSQLNHSMQQAAALIMQYLSDHLLPSDHLLKIAESGLNPQHPGINTKNPSFNIETSEIDPQIFVVIEDGKNLGVFRKAQLSTLKQPTDGLVFDATTNTLQIRHTDDKEARTLDLTQRGRVRGQAKIKKPAGPAPGGSTLEILRVMMENPDQRFTKRIINYYENKKLGVKTFIKYVERLRNTLGDNQSNNPFIVTDNGVDTSTSKTRSAYCLNPDYAYRVIRYVKCR